MFFYYFGAVTFSLVIAIATVRLATYFDKPRRK